MTREQKLEEALKLIADTFDKNHGRQDEKLLDIPKIARAALSAPKAEAVCEDCGRHIHTENRPALGWLATCGKRLTRLEECGSEPRCTVDEYGEPILPSSPVPAITDEAVERAAKAIHDGPLGANDEEDFGDNKASDWCREVARAALLAAFPSKGEGK